MQGSWGRFRAWLSRRTADHQAATLSAAITDQLARERAFREDFTHQVKDELARAIAGQLAQERAFREDFTHQVKGELTRFIEDRLRFYFGFRQTVTLPETGRVLTHTVDGHRLYLDTREPFITLHLIENGEWEAHVRRAIRALLRPGDRFVDVGANIGIHSVFAGHIVGPGGSVIALEPHPRMRGLLRENLEINGLLDQVRVLPFAASDRSDEAVDFEYFVDHPAMSGFRITPSRLVQFDGTKEVITVPTRTIDDVLRPLGLSAALVKIDVEGFEVAVLRGCAELIRNDRDVAFIVEYQRGTAEPGPDGDAATALTHLFDGSGFAVFEIRHEGPPARLSYQDLAHHDGGDFIFARPGSRGFAAL